MMKASGEKSVVESVVFMRLIFRLGKAKAYNEYIA